MRRLLPILAMLSAAAQNVIPTCDCDAAKPETLLERRCSLSNEAAKQPPEPDVFFLKDINPRKANRTLALPRQEGRYRLDDLTPAERTRLWSAAIEKARELWGDDWAVAYNGDEVRTQCHIHLHIGKLNSAAKLSEFLEVKSPAEIPAPQGKGIWIYGDGRKIRVHTGEQITETALVR
jgi:diadenosine tetraphosphate (Ap4A) HIT family hydrolase